MECEGRTLMLNSWTSKDMILTSILLLVVSLGHASGSCLKPNITWLSVDILDTVLAVPDPYQCQAIQHSYYGG